MCRPDSIVPYDHHAVHPAAFWQDPVLCEAAEIGENRFGGESVNYLGVGPAKKWERIESYGPKLVENIVQGIARDLLADVMWRLECVGIRIVAHVHDELIIEAEPGDSAEEVCRIMGEAPACVPGLLLRADGYECEYYRKE